MKEQPESSGEIVVFTSGDSADPATWSNIPCCLTQALIRRGFHVRRVDLSVSEKWHQLYYYTVWNVLKLIFRGKNDYDLSRTRLFRFIINARVKRAVRKYSDAEIFISLPYCCQVKNYTDRPCLLICDWTFEHLIRSIKRRTPNSLEMDYIRFQREVIVDTDIVVSLFKTCAMEMSEIYGREVIYLGQNVINDLNPAPLSPEQMLSLKQRDTKTILFIGKKKYSGSAGTLIRAYRKICSEISAELHIIGMTRADLGVEEEESGIFCHGYLNKGRADDRSLYYELLSKATVVVNTSAGWAGYSSIVEAMYYHTPVIVSDYDEIVNDFGRDISRFGIYMSDPDEEELAKGILSIVNHASYSSLALSAHDAVANYTWDSWVGKLLDVVRRGVLHTP